jgi:tetratricopeptide (TPR) repeat protein
MRRPLFFGLLVALSIPAVARAEDANAASPAVRRDPKGITGLSPFQERIARGDVAAAARDFDGALALYREAVTENPEHPLGHYRVAQLNILKGDLKEAEVAYGTALEKAGKAPAIRAKILFALATLRERQKSHDEAIQRFTEYESLAQESPKAKTFPAAAAERKKRNQAFQKNQSDSAEVRARIEKRLKDTSAPRK